MSFDKEKENGTLNNNFYSHTLHPMYSNGPTPFNTSPASSPSVGNYAAMSMYGNNNNNTSITTTPNGNNATNNNRYPATLHQQHLSSDLTSASPNATPYLARQLTYAQISRQSSSPHHHARAAAAMARNTPVPSTVTITDPNDPTHNKTLARTTTATTTKEGSDLIWTSLDMGGMGFKNISPALYTYRFLTSLYLNHNNLSFLTPELSQLTQLQTLDVSGNKLTTVPAELGLLVNLKDLLLFDNLLATLPNELGTLYQLETLGLEGNPLQADLKNILIKDGTQALIISLRENAPVGIPPPHREWLLIEGDTLEDPNKITVLGYNILCPKYATAQAYGYTPSWALSWNYRKELLVSELLNYNADVICLQEMEMGQYEEFFKDHFKKMGDYDSIFYPKTRVKILMNEKERRAVDGCATFYKTTKFRLIENELIEYNQKALQRPDFKQTADIYNRVMNKDNIAVFSLLEHKDSQKRLVVANSHVHWVPSDADVKLVQVGVLMDELERFTRKHSTTLLPTVISGDFNSTPDSGVYEFFSKGLIQQGHDDFGNHSYGTYTTEGLSHPFQLKSAYSHLGELPFTNYTPGYKGVLDYIWYTANTLDVVSLLGPIDHDYLSKVVGFPNAHFPSDHIPIMVELKFKTQNNQKESRKADFSSTRSNNR
ncbi:MAG: Endonuclease/exonuclease/phosphatase [Benjaminiella poitrasii]|nr:MAG: Endonuclease/exonuclease/phosphatase [Benjaminiella poitrasii]